MSIIIAKSGIDNHYMIWKWPKKILISKDMI